MTTHLFLSYIFYLSLSLSLSLSLISSRVCVRALVYAFVALLSEPQVNYTLYVFTFLLGISCV